jgi:hypothetical protein
MSENLRKSISKEDGDANDDGSPKKFYADRDKTEKFVTKPMKKYVF